MSGTAAGRGWPGTEAGVGWCERRGRWACSPAVEDLIDSALRFRPFSVASEGPPRRSGSEGEPGPPREPQTEMEGAARGEPGDEVVGDHAVAARQPLGLAGAERFPHVEDP